MERLLAPVLVAALVASCSCSSDVLWEFDPATFNMDQVGDWNPMGQYPDSQKYFFIPPGIPVAEIPTHSKISIDANGAAVIMASPYTITQALNNDTGSPKDNAKSTYLTTKAWSAAPEKGQPILRIRSRMSARSFNLSSHPFPDNLVTKPFDDLRLGMAGLSVVDQSTALSPVILLTNQGIYMMYHIDTFIRPYTCDSHAFFQVKRVGDRRPDDFHNLAIEYDANANTLSFYLEKKRVWRVGNLGFAATGKGVVTILDCGGAPLPINRFNPAVGFGNFNLLDASDYHRPNKNMGLVRTRGNYALGSILAPGAVDYFSSGNYCKTSKVEGDDLSAYVHPTKFWDEESLLQNRLWGGGSHLTVESLVIETDSEPWKK